MSRPARVSPERILSAAALEFSARGFSGARVDRIARRARVNKAMLYYHFGNKQGLYRALLLKTFGAAAERLNAVAAGSDPPEQKVGQLVVAFADIIAEHAHFPAIMLREVAEGGTHLDKETLAAMAVLPAIVGRVVTAGARGGVLRRVHPVMAYFTIVAPIVLYLGGAPIRKALAAHGLLDLAELSSASFIQQMQTSVRLSLVSSDSAKAAP